MNNKKEIKETAIEPLFEEISDLIKEARQKAQVKVNSELVILYWNIGRVIKREILKNRRADYGYSRSNLFRMVRLYEVHQNKEIVATLSRQLSWSHFVEIVKFEDSLKREFYTQMCINEKWGVRTLRGRIRSMLYERTAISKKPEQTIINDLKLLGKEKKMSLDLFLKDPYLLDFLEWMIHSLKQTLKRPSFMN
jgi:hypothetical protein